MAAAAGDGPTNHLCQQLQQDMQAQFGFAANIAWLQQMVTQLQQEHAGFTQQSRSMQLQLLLEQLLMADFRVAGAGGVLPQDLKVMCCSHSLLSFLTSI
jgi:3-keto-L-gulonate-6-phosphate decarboxylase